MSFAFEITGPFNIQFIAKANDIKVIECNLRASRSFPFVSKVTKHNFIDIATKAIMGAAQKEKYNTLDFDYVGVKSPQFSFSRLTGADPLSGVEMASTGEVACFGDSLEEAFLKSFLSVGYTIPRKSVLLSTGGAESKADLLESCRLLYQMGYQIYATFGTRQYLRQNKIPSIGLHWPTENKKPSMIDHITNKKIDLVINIPKSYARKELTNGYLIRRTAVDYNVPLITNVQIAKLFILSISKYRRGGLSCKSWGEYIQ